MCGAPWTLGRRRAPFGRWRKHMPLVTENVPGSIGNPPLVEVHKVVPAGCGRVFAELEWTNPTGSMNDRMAAAAIRNAEADGRLQPGGTVIEYTVGTTGISLALVFAARAMASRSYFRMPSAKRSAAPCRPSAPALRMRRATSSRSPRR